MSAAMAEVGNPLEDEFWSVWDRGEVLDAIFSAAETCDPGEFLFGASDADWHEEPEDYQLDDLIDMFIYDEEMCPLHVKASYPYAVQGEVARQFSHAHDRLNAHTMRHTGSPLNVRGDDGRWHYYATEGELRQCWQDFPHARHVFEHFAQEGDDLVIHVVAGE